MPLTEVRYDPFDPAIIADPFPAYRLLRDEAPVFWAEASNSWVLSRHGDVRAALLDTAAFSSVDGIFPAPAGTTSVVDSFLPMLITMDPPRHDRLRALVSRGFTARRISGMEQGITRACRDLIGGLGGTDFADFVADFAGVLPVVIIADLLGIPAADRQQFRTWTNHIVQLDPIHGATQDGLTALADLYEYLTGFLCERRRAPQEDLMSSLAHAVIDGTRLTDDEVLGFCALLLIAGNETTTNLLANSAVILSLHPESRHRLANRPELVAPAVEELMRYESPVQGLVRRLNSDVTLHGTTMLRGDAVLLLFGSANRDERVFAEPDRFDIDRRPDRHLAFGKGVHFCLGAALARMEATIGLTQLLKHGCDWEVDLAAAQRLRSGPVRGFKSLPVRWTASRRL